MATTTTTPDVDSLSLDDIRKLAEEEAKKATTTQDEKPPVEEEEKPPQQEEEEEEQPTPKVFYAERTIDLGDGAGVQVFKGKGASREEALEDLSNKLTTAQVNATKKIRELAAKVKPEPTVSKEDESLLAAEIVTTPSEVVKKVLKNAGLDIDKLKTVTAEADENRAAKAKKVVADQFVKQHPEFLDNDRNGQRLAKATSLLGDFTLENLEKAYQDLTESGLLEVKDEEAGDGQGKDKTKAGDSAPTSDDTPPQRTKKTKSLSTHNRSVAPTSTTPSEDDMYSMPLDELRKNANKQLAGR